MSGIQTSKITTATDENLQLDPAGSGKVKINGLEGASVCQIAVDANGEVQKLNADELPEMSEPVSGDKIVVQAGSSRSAENIVAGYIYGVDTDNVVGSKGIDPSPADVEATPAFLGGSGTQSDPYICTPSSVSEPGGTANSVQTISVIGTELALVSMTDISEGAASGRFAQPSGQIVNGVYSFSLVYNDTPNTPVGDGQVYDGRVKLGATTVYFKWEVSQVSNASGFGPASSPTASPSTVNFPGNGKYGTVTTTWSDGTRVINSDGNVVFGVNNGVMSASSKNVLNGDSVKVAFNASAISAASEGDTVTGVLQSQDGVYYNAFSIVKDTTPGVFTLPSLTGQGNGVVVTGSPTTLAGFNCPTTVTAPVGGANPLTSVEVSVAGAAFTSTFPVTYNPGDSLQVRGTTGATANTQYSTTFTVGGTSAVFSVSTGALVVGDIVQPQITNPPNMDGNDQATDVIITSTPAAYQDGASITHQSSDWQAYKSTGNAAAQTIQSDTITGVAVGPSFTTITLASNANLGRFAVGNVVKQNTGYQPVSSAITSVEVDPGVWVQYLGIDLSGMDSRITNFTYQKIAFSPLLNRYLIVGWGYYGPSYSPEGARWVVAYSDDQGITWTEIPDYSVFNLNRPEDKLRFEYVIWNPDRSEFLMLESDSGVNSKGQNFISSDGINWTTGDLERFTQNPSFSGLIWSSSQSRYLRSQSNTVYGDPNNIEGDSSVAYSTDGLIWSDVMSVNHSWYGLAYSPPLDVFVLWGAYYRGDEFNPQQLGYAYSSPSSVTSWTRTDTNANPNSGTPLRGFQSIVWGGDRFVGVGQYGVRISFDGASWENTSNIVYTGEIFYGNGLFIIREGDNPKRTLTSADGYEWTVYAKTDVNSVRDMFWVDSYNQWMQVGQVITSNPNGVALSGSGTGFDGTKLTLTNNQDLAFFESGDIVQSSKVWNQSQDWVNTVTVAGDVEAGSPVANVFDSNLVNFCSPTLGSDVELRFTGLSSASTVAVRLQRDATAFNNNSALFVNGVNQNLTTTGLITTADIDVSGTGLSTLKFTMPSIDDKIQIAYIAVDGAILVNNGLPGNNGEEFQATTIDTTNNRIITNGGSYQGSNGTSRGLWDQSRTWSAGLTITNPYSNVGSQNGVGCFEGNVEYSTTQNVFSNLDATGTTTVSFSNFTFTNTDVIELLVSTNSTNMEGKAYTVSTNAGNKVFYARSTAQEVKRLYVTGVTAINSIAMQCANNGSLTFIGIIVNGNLLVNTGVAGAPTAETSVKVLSPLKEGSGTLGSVNLNTNQMTLADPTGTFVTNSNSGSGTGTPTAFAMTDVTIPGSPQPPNTEPPNATDFTLFEESLTDTTNLDSWQPSTEFPQNSTIFTRVKYRDASANTSAYSPWSGFNVQGVPDVGQEYGGGFFVGQMYGSNLTSGGGLDDGGVIYNIIMAPKATGERGVQTTEKPINPGTTTNFSDSQSFGKVAQDSNTDSNFVYWTWARNLTIGGFTDWYVPAILEMQLLYRALKPTGDSNNTSYGANPYGVPVPLGNYTPGSPAPTELAAFIEPSGTEYLSTHDAGDVNAKRFYWTSTVTQPYDNRRVLAMSPRTGSLDEESSNNDAFVRVIRREAA